MIDIKEGTAICIMADTHPCMAIDYIIGKLISSILKGDTDRQLAEVTMTLELAFVEKFVKEHYDESSYKKTIEYANELAELMKKTLEERS